MGRVDALDDDLEAVRTCAASGACPPVSAWKNEGAFKCALRRQLRRSMREFGERAFAVRARADENGGVDGLRRTHAGEGGEEDAREGGGRARREDDGASSREQTEGSDLRSPEAKRARKAEESDATAAMDEDDEIESAATVAAMRRAYEEDVERIATACVDAHDSDAPFTIQRICELVCEPERYYSTPYKLATAMMKLFAVTQTVDRAPDALERRADGADGATTSASPERAPPPPTKAMERDARDPVATEQKAFISAAFRETAPKSAYEGTAITHPPRPPSPQTVL